MTDKTIRKGKTSTSNQKLHTDEDNPGKSARHYTIQSDPGIVVDVEIQLGDPIDSQFIRNFMGEFEAAKSRTN